MKNLKLFFIFSVFFINSCVITQNELWGNKYRNEKITDLLVKRDAREIVLQGKNYCYLLIDDSGNMKDISNLVASSKIVNTSSAIFLAKDSSVKVRIWLVMNISDLTKKELDLFDQLGAQKFNSSKNIELSFYLNGVQKNTCISSSLVSTGWVKNEYEDQITVPPSSLKTAGKILLTPFAVVADILMAPFYMIGVFGMGAGSK